MMTALFYARPCIGTLVDQSQSRSMSQKGKNQTGPDFQALVMVGVVKVRFCGRDMNGGIKDSV